MVVRNGWHVWRQRWPSPSARDRLQWWSITMLLALCRLADARQGGVLSGIEEALGRIAGAASIAMEAGGPSSSSLILNERKE
jgi:hypothetical protein